jgi:hypothetical protein
MYEITKSDLAKGRRLKAGAIAAPVVFTLVPAAIMIMLLIAVFGSPTAIIVLTVGLIATFIGFFLGVITSAMLAKKRSTWTREMREKIAADGIKADEIGWFRNELKPAEKRALKAIEGRDPMLADAYRETLASRLTASRIVKASRQEMTLARRRQNSLKQLKSSRSEEFQAAVVEDIGKIGKINEEAKQMLAEAESRLQIIEAAASRAGTLADHELALKKLSARTAELPLALEEAKMADDIRKELEAEERSNASSSS